MVLVATLATSNSLSDLRIFLKTLQLWNGPMLPTVYLFCDAALTAAVASDPLEYRGTIHVKEVLDKYASLTRTQMEQMPGLYGSLWSEFMAQKITLLEWVFEDAAAAATDGVFFFDADICFFGPLPTVPTGATVALSPHFIRERDEARYGTYNGGFLWFRNPAHLSRWRGACATSRFYEQAALEVFTGDPGLYVFPIQHNYGWWRFFQGTEPADVRARAWGFRRSPEHSGITVSDAPLGSIHTHWGIKQPFDVQTFDGFVLNLLKKLAKAHSPAKEILRILETAHNAGK